jgi:hypothetical protein
VKTGLKSAILYSFCEVCIDLVCLISMDVVKLMFGQDLFGFNTEIVMVGVGNWRGILRWPRSSAAQIRLPPKSASLKSTSGQTLQRQECQISTTTMPTNQPSRGEPLWTI